MNFAQVRNIVGQKDESGYQAKLEMKGTIGNAPDFEYAQQSGAKFQRVMITDAQGETNKVKIYTGKGTGLNENHIGQPLTFLIGPNPSQGGKMYYNGFWQRPKQTAPPQGQQAPQQPRQATKGQQGTSIPLYESIRIRAYEGACVLFSKADNCTDKEVLVFAQKAAEFIATGQLPKSDNYEPDYEHQIDDLSPQREPGQDDEPENPADDIPY